MNADSVNQSCSTIPQAIDEIATGPRMVKMYLQASTSELMIENATQGDRLRIYTMLGDLRRNVYLSSANPSVDVSDLSSGIYIALLTHSKGVAKMKFVKE